MTSYLHKLCSFFFISVFTCSMSHAAPHPVFSQGFEANSGQLISLPDAAPLKEGQKYYLVAFWAGWCVPCKEELSLIARSPEVHKNYSTIAINVDEPSDVVAAMAGLKSLNWESPSLRDPSGAFFFKINQSGELPLAFVLNSKGELLQTLRKLDHSALDKLVEEGKKDLSNLEDKRTNHSQTWKISTSGIFLNGIYENKTKAAYGTRMSVGYAGPWADLQVSHHLLRQKRGQWENLEDELGYSYALARFKPLDRFSLETILGDKDIKSAHGLLVSVRENPTTPEDNSLQGLHALAYGEILSLQLSAGRTRALLPIRDFNLEQDLSRTVPETRVIHSQLQIQVRKTENYSTSLNSGFARLIKEKQDAVPVATTENRFHLGGKLNYLQSETSLNWVRYLNYSSAHSGYATMADVLIPVREATLSFAATQIEFQPEYVEVPSLVDQLGKPLDSTSRRAGRVQVKVDNLIGKSTTTFQGTREETLEDSGSRQDFKNHMYTSIIFPTILTKASLYGSAAHLKSLSSREQELAAQVSSPVWKMLSWQGEVRDLRETSSSDQTSRLGNLYKLNLEYGLFHSEISEPLGEGRLSLQTAHAHQVGSFRDTSGIDKSTLNAAFLVWRGSAWAMKMGGGQEPGGFVCTDGVCAQKPPLNGILAEATGSWQF
jgi:thiol-disulfide isomerase/thioredoxin